MGLRELFIDHIMNNENIAFSDSLSLVQAYLTHSEFRIIDVNEIR